MSGSSRTSWCAALRGAGPAAAAQPAASQPVAAGLAGLNCLATCSSTSLQLCLAAGCAVQQRPWLRPVALRWVGANGRPLRPRPRRAGARGGRGGRRDRERGGGDAAAPVCGGALHGGARPGAHHLHRHHGCVSGPWRLLASTTRGWSGVMQTLPVGTSPALETFEWRSCPLGLDSPCWLRSGSQRA